VGTTGFGGGRRAALGLAALFALLGLAVLASACVMLGDDHLAAMRAMHSGADTSGGPAVRAGAEATVDMRGSAFRPGNLVVPVGARVTWVNRDAVPHDAASIDGGWATPILKEGESATLTLDTAGEYDYRCRVHPSMKAKLTVVAAVPGG
jgi:plastocyanin